ncbi:MAG: HAD hydrolase-like protein [Patescibacteria group bacterium]|nr:HAD hydrolase-like protein [Patescibacteria group bacterium]
MILYLLDFDDTLANTSFPSGSKEAIFAIAKTPQEGRQLYDQTKEENQGMFMFSQYIQKLGLSPFEAEKKLKPLLQDNLFTDSLDFLHKIKSQENSLAVIVSYGEPYWQNLKIKLCGADKLVDHIVITDEKHKKNDIQAMIDKYQPKKTIYIDDSVHVSGEDFDHPVEIHHMDRTKTKKGNDTIHSLK